jgi:hypothetical protein
MGNEDTGAAGMYEAAAEADANPQAGNQAEEAQRLMAETAQSWQDMLSTLIPERNVIIEDVTGAKHALRCQVPATVETDLSRKLDELMAAPDIGGHFEKMLSAPNNGDRLVSIMRAFTNAAQDHTILQLLSDSFVMAHPRAAKAGIANVKADEYMSEFIPENEPAQPKHAFERMEMVKALFPFVLLQMAALRDMLTQTAPKKQIAEA